MSSEIDTVLSKRTIELGLGNKKGSSLTPLSTPQKWDESLHNESEASQPVHYLFKIQEDHPKTDQGGQLPGSLGSLTGH